MALLNFSTLRKSMQRQSEQQIYSRIMDARLESTEASSVSATIVTEEELLFANQFLPFSASTTSLSNSCIEYCSWVAPYPIETITREGRANGMNVCDDSSIYLRNRYWSCSVIHTSRIARVFYFFNVPYSGMNVPLRYSLDNVGEKGLFCIPLESSRAISALYLHMQIVFSVIQLKLGLPDIEQDVHSCWRSSF
jgi:hypothetical protein